MSLKRLVSESELATKILLVADVQSSKSQFKRGDSDTDIGKRFHHLVGRRYLDRS